MTIFDQTRQIDRPWILARPVIEVFTRNADDSGTPRDVRQGKVRLDDIECVLDVEAIYADPLG